MLVKKKKIKKMKVIAPLLIVMISCFLILTVFFVNTSSKKVYTIDVSQKLESAKKKDNDYGKTIGWLNIYDTGIDLPVLNIPEEEGADLEVNFSDFAWNVGETEEFQNHMVIQGHNLRNLSSNPEIDLKYFERFDNLPAFLYIDYAKEHQYFQYTMNGTTHVYKIFSVFITDTAGYTLVSREASLKENKRYINKYLKDTMYDYDVEVNEKDNILVLLTCTRFYGEDNLERTVMVVGRELRKNEKMKDYKVIANNKYKRVLKQMKNEGDEMNEA